MWLRQTQGFLTQSSHPCSAQNWQGTLEKVYPTPDFSRASRCSAGAWGHHEKSEPRTELTSSIFMYQNRISTHRACLWPLVFAGTRPSYPQSAPETQLTDTQFLRRDSCVDIHMGQHWNSVRQRDVQSTKCGPEPAVWEWGRRLFLSDSWRVSRKCKQSILKSEKVQNLSLKKKSKVNEANENHR